MRQACFTENILLRVVRQLVNGTKTNQFLFSTLFKLRSIFYMKITFLGWSISVSIDHVILDFPMICVISYTCAITSNTPHTKTMNNIRYEVSQGVSMCPKTVSRCPESISVKYSGVSRNKLRGVLRFQRNHPTAMTYRGLANAKFKKK